MKISDFTEMSIRARIALNAAGILNLEEASWKTDEELLAIEGVGESSINKIREWRKEIDARAARDFALMRAERDLEEVESHAKELAAVWIGKGSAVPSTGMMRACWEVAICNKKLLQMYAKEMVENGGT